MPLSAFDDYPGRFALSNELHARPFPEISIPCKAICLAFRNPDRNDVAADRAQLIRLLERSGADLPPEDAVHYYGRLGNRTLKWERHTEFVTYTLFSETDPEQPFAVPGDLLPSEWSAEMPGKLLTATMVHIEAMPSTAELAERVQSRAAGWFVQESTAMAMVLDEDALVIGDFRVDANGFTRFAVLAAPETGKRRLGRITQRLLEIENYKAMSMLSLPVARQVGRDLSDLDTRLGTVIADFSSGLGEDDKGLSELLDISEHVENLAAHNMSRFSAADAYSTIVFDRIDVLRETRFEGRQTLAEFMTRRFKPAMRTVASTAARLNAVAERTARAGDMLRTRTDVARAEQNQSILARMDERAAQQLRLQQTVEGLSVVAVSYYAVNLASYMIAPMAAEAGITKAWVTGLLVPPVLLIVWSMIRRIKKHI